MTDFHEFVGTWRAEPGAPFSTHTFTWTIAAEGLRGEWVIEAASEVGNARPWSSNDPPRRVQMQIGNVSLDEGRVLFVLNGSPFPAEFRLVAPREAVVGAAVDRIPPELSGPEYHRSVEGHRVRFRKLGETAA
jgi:hypothetical protein